MAEARPKLCVLSSKKELEWLESLKALLLCQFVLHGRSKDRREGRKAQLISFLVGTTQPTGLWEGQKHGGCCHALYFHLCFILWSSAHSHAASPGRGQTCKTPH